METSKTDPLIDVIIDAGTGVRGDAPDIANAEGAESAKMPHDPVVEEEADSIRRTISRRFDSMVRQISMAGANVTGVFPEIYCQICMSTFPRTESFTLSSCGHTFCKSCTLAWFSSNVKEANLNFGCVHDTASDPSEPVEQTSTLEGGPVTPAAVAHTSTGPCRRPVAEADILNAFADSPQDLQRYEHFKTAKTQPNMRTCPYPNCVGRQLGDPKRPAMFCETCSREYCFVHANAHLGRTCEAYEKQATREARLQDAVGEIKNCPKCKAPTTKASGCAHMICSVCKTDWCWLCSQKIDSGELPAHYAWFNLLSPCAGRQLVDRGPVSTCYRVFQWTFGLLTLLIFGVPALAIILVSMILLPCAFYVALRREKGRRLQFFYDLFMRIIAQFVILLLAAIIFPFFVIGTIVMIFVSIFRCLCCCCLRGRKKQTASAARQRPKSPAAVKAASQT